MSLNSFLKAATDPRFSGLFDSSLYPGAGLAVPPLPVIDPNSKRALLIAAKLNAISPEEFQRRTREYDAFAQKDYNHETKKTENEKSLTVALLTAPVEEQKPPPIDENELTAPVERCVEEKKPPLVDENKHTAPVERFVEEQNPPPIDVNEVSKEERLLFYVRRAKVTVDRYQLEAQQMSLEAETVRRDAQKVIVEAGTARRDTQRIILEAAENKLTAPFERCVEEQKPPPINENELTAAVERCVEDKKPPPIDENKHKVPVESSVEEQKPPPIDVNEVSKDERLLFYACRAKLTVARHHLEAQKMILEAETVRLDVEKVILEAETARRDAEMARRDANASLLELEKLKQAPTRAFGGDRAGNSAMADDGYDRPGRGMLPPDSRFYGYDMEGERGDGGYSRDGGYARDGGYTNGGDDRGGRSLDALLSTTTASM